MGWVVGELRGEKFNTLVLLSASKFDDDIDDDDKEYNLVQCNNSQMNLDSKK